MEKKIAAQLYISRNNGDDITLRLLQVVSLTAGADISKVIEAYNLILTGVLKVAHVSSSVKLENSQQEDIKNKVKQKFPTDDLVFIFEINSKIEHGLEIKVGDDAITFSINTKLSELLAENGN